MKIITSRALHILFLLFFIWVYWCVISDYVSNGYYLQIAAGLTLTVSGVILFFVIKKNNIRISAKTSAVIFICMELLMLTIHLIIMFKLGYTPVSDAEYVDTAAKNFALTGSYEGIINSNKPYYFSNYPNNWGILLLLSFIYRGLYLLLGYIPVYTSQIINLICIHSCGILLYLTAKLIFKDRIKPLFCSAMFVFSPAFYTNGPVFYTDTLSAPFVIGSVFLFLKAVKSKNLKTFTLFIVCTALTLGSGYCFKGSIAVLIVAFALYGFIKIGWKRSLCLTGALIISVFALGASVRQTGLYLGISDKATLEKYEMPTTHWINMSLVGSGRFNAKEKNYIAQFDTLEERNSECIKRIKKRLSDYGIKGIIKQAEVKITNTWNEGTFYGRYLDESENTALRYSLTEGRAMDLYSKAMLIFLLNMMIFSFIHGAFHRRISHASLIRLAVFGFALFFVIWEIKPRYLVNFLPLMFIISADGINYLSELVSYPFKKLRRADTQQSHK